MNPRRSPGGLRGWRTGLDETGFTVIEILLVIAIVSLLFLFGALQWREYTELQRVRYGTVQLATDVREAMERAKAERNAYTVSVTAASSGYSIARTAGGYTENTTLPLGVMATVTQVVRFSPFGKPIDDLGAPAGYVLTVQNPKGTGVVTVTPAGGVTYQEP
jgi:prepilin-type N-terminal cleavage/methylation domain-containing protein